MLDIEVSQCISEPAQMKRNFIRTKKRAEQKDKLSCVIDRFIEKHSIAPDINIGITKL
jgi:hypothetical protein